MNGEKSLQTQKFYRQSVAKKLIEFSSLPQQAKAPKENKFSIPEQLAVEQEIKKLLTKGIIAESAHEPNGFISPIFRKPKPDGSYKLILNLKGLNKYVVYRQWTLFGVQLDL